MRTRSMAIIVAIAYVLMFWLTGCNTLRGTGRAASDIANGIADDGQAVVNSADQPHNHNHDY
jgi:predicted small secreted protein